MRPGSKLGGNVELLTHSQLMLARGRNLDIITQAQAIDIFLPIGTAWSSCPAAFISRSWLILSPKKMSRTGRCSICSSTR